jgi:predicted PurR-regulated permease PerM
VVAYRPCRLSKVGALIGRKGWSASSNRRLCAGLGTAALGLPYAVVLGVLAGLFHLVPMNGSILSAAPAIIVALFMPFPTVVWLLLLFIIIEQLADNVLAPRISGDAVGIHPLGVMFALLAGFQVAEVLGAIFAVPLAGVLWAVLGAAYRDATTEPATPNNSPTRQEADQADGGVKATPS